MRLGFIVLCLLMAGIGHIGCSDDSGNEADLPLPGNSPTLDKQIQELQPGISLKTVRAKLGKPLGERSFEDEPAVHMLFYGRWQLLFENGKLDRRIKYVIERNPPDAALIDKEERSLQRRVLSLKPGVAKAAVRATLGPPDTYEIIRSAPHRREVLSYELWDLTFIDNALVLRNKR